MNSYVIAADIGGSGTKTMAFDDQLNIVAQHFIPSRQCYDNGRVFFDAEEMYDSVVDGIRACVAKSGISSGSVDAIILDGQMAGLVWVGEHHMPLSYYDTWLDTSYAPFAKKMREICGERIYRQTGTHNYTHGPKVLWWKENRPEVYRANGKWVTPHCYVGGRLAALGVEQAYIDKTCLFSNGICDLQKAEWDEELCRIVGISPDKQARIVNPTDIVGRLSGEAAARLGLNDGIPIVAGAGDTAAAGIGIGICRPGLAGDVCGTASSFFVCSDQWVYDGSGIFRPCRSVIPGLWYYNAWFNGGACLRWFKEQFGFQDDQRARELGLDYYSYSEALCKDIPVGCDGLIAYPYIGGKSNNPLLQGLCIGARFEHRRAHFYRALMEGVVCEYMQCHASLKNMLGSDSLLEVRAIGGGAKSALWDQMKASALNTPWVVPAQQECSLLGSAMIALHAIGVIDDLAAFSEKSFVKKESFAPIADEGYQFARLLKRYAEKLEQIEGVFIESDL